MKYDLRHSWACSLITLAGAAVITVSVSVLVAYSGLVDVSATSPPSALAQWFLSTTRNHSVASRAGSLEVPDLTSSHRVAEGAEHYSEMCQGCHGAPGLDQSEMARGLEPPPPKLWKGSFNEEASKDAFWVVKNGIAMTGMPAFGVTHDDEKIWDIVAFVRKLHGMTPTQYLQLTKASHHEVAQEHGHAHDAD